MQVKPRRILILALLGIVFLTVVYLLGWSNLFSLKQIDVRTNDQANRSQIESRLSSADIGLKVGDSMARINVRAISRVLREEDWIGRVVVERDWFDGVVSIRVKERAPVMSIERSARNIGQPVQLEEFVDLDGTVFTLPGDLATKYRQVPLLRLESDAVDARLSALKLLSAIEEELPTRKITATALSNLISESQPGGGAAAGVGKQWIEIRWGSGDDLELKLEVVRELLGIKANQGVKRIDVSNPGLPIVS